MKALIVNTCFAFGSTGRIVEQEYKYLHKMGVDVYVAYAYDLDNSKLYKRDNHLYLFGNNISKFASAGLTRILGDQLGHAYFSSWKLLGIIKKIQPDVVHIHCVNVYSCNHYILVNWLKINGYRVVLTEHAEYYYTGNCSYVFECQKWKHGCNHCPSIKESQKSLIFDTSSRNWKKMRKALSCWDNRIAITAVSPWLMNKSLQSDITKDLNHYCICNGVNTSVFFRPEEYENDSENPYLLFVVPGSMFGVKGGQHIVELAKRLPQLKMVVVGTEKPNGDYPSNMIFVPHTSNQQELVKYYRNAVATIITSKRETFSMVVAESLCCGTPVIGFLCGGAESIALNEFSAFVDYGNIEDMIKAINGILEKGYIDRSRISKEAIATYNSERMCREYYSLLIKMADHANKIGDKPYA